MLFSYDNIFICKDKRSFSNIQLNAVNLSLIFVFTQTPAILLLCENVFVRVVYLLSKTLISMGNGALSRIVRWRRAIRLRAHF